MQSYNLNLNFSTQSNNIITVFINLALTGNFVHFDPPPGFRLPQRATTVAGASIVNLLLSRNACVLFLCRDSCDRKIDME